MADRSYFNTHESILAVSPASRDTRWVALNNDNAIISEGDTPDEAITKAQNITTEYTLMFIPIEGNTYFF